MSDQSAITHAAQPMTIPTSSSNADAPGLHASFAEDTVTQKPNQQSPPRCKSPMPPTASLTDAGIVMQKQSPTNAPISQHSSPQKSDSFHNSSNTATMSSTNTASTNGHSYDGQQSHPSDQQQQQQQQQEQKATSSSLPIPSPPAEVEATLTKLTSHANVQGVLVLSRPEALVIRSGGAYFEPSGPGASERAVRLKSVVEMVRNVIQTLERDIGKAEAEDELSFLRIRTKKYEMMLSPSEKYLLVVIQDPTVSS